MTVIVNLDKLPENTRRRLEAIPIGRTKLVLDTKVERVGDDAFKVDGLDATWTAHTVMSFFFPYEPPNSPFPAA